MSPNLGSEGVLSLFFWAQKVFFVLLVPESFLFVYSFFYLCFFFFGGGGVVRVAGL